MALKFIYLLLTVLGLRCWQAFSCCREWGLPFVGSWASPCGGISYCGAQALGRGFSNCSSWALEHRLSSCAACGIFPDQGFSLCPLHWQVGSDPWCHQGSPRIAFTNWIIGNGFTKGDSHLIPKDDLKCFSIVDKRGIEGTSKKKYVT